LCGAGVATRQRRRDRPGIAIATIGASLAPPSALVIDSLRQQKGNVTFAARKLGVSRDTLRYRMDEYELNREDYV
jgi:DNA-binding NtrC family response regulator